MVNDATFRAGALNILNSLVAVKNIYDFLKDSFDDAIEDTFKICSFYMFGHIFNHYFQNSNTVIFLKPFIYTGLYYVVDRSAEHKSDQVMTKIQDSSLNVTGVLPNILVENFFAESYQAV